MLDLLRSLEWAGGSDADGWCPTCGGAGRHEPDCRLDRAIREMAEADPDGARLREMAAALGWAVMTVAPNAPYREEDMRFRAGNGNFRTAADVRRAYAEVHTLYREHKANAAWADAMLSDIGRTLKQPTPGQDVRPTFADKLRALGLPPEADSDGDYFQEQGADLQGRLDGWRYIRPDESEDPRRWSTAEAAVDDLYREWVAKQQAALGARPDSPPTDPSALAAWLYARVVPGVWVEWRTIGGTLSKGPPLRAAAKPDYVAFYLSGGETVLAPAQEGQALTFVRLLNPDGTVLWESRS